MSESGAPSPSLSAINRTLVALAGRIESLEMASNSAPSAAGDSTRLEGRVRQIEQVLTEVRKVVSGLGQQKTAKDAEVQLRRPWHMLTSEQAEKRWLVLRAWVQFLVERNNIGAKEIPDCWYLHGGMVDELEALRWAWIDANRPESKGSDRIWWREALTRARLRWPAFNPNGCSTTHSEPGRRAFNDESKWEMFLSEELADRPADRPSQAS